MIEKNKRISLDWKVISNEYPKIKPTTGLLSHREICNRITVISGGLSFYLTCRGIPSGKLTKSYWKWPSRNSGFTHWKTVIFRYVSLLEGTAQFPRVWLTLPIPRSRLLVLCSLRTCRNGHAIRKDVFAMWNIRRNTARWMWVKMEDLGDHRC